MSVCQGCKAEILWAITKNKRSIPLDAIPDPAGNIAMTGEVINGRWGRRGPECRVIGPVGMFDDGIVRYMPHHASCPNVEDFRE